jgi:hypothetical protein
VALALIGSGLTQAADAGAAEVDVLAPVTDAPVRAVAQSGDITCLGGDFTYIGPRTGAFVGVSAAGTLDPDWAPNTNGVVRALAVQPSAVPGLLLLCLRRR